MIRNTLFRRVVYLGALTFTIVMIFMLVDHNLYAMQTLPVNQPFTDYTDWVAFRNRFLSEDGRVIDNSQGGLSHSESQGYGMLLATHYGDRPSFEIMLDWTERNLGRPTDHLSAWRFNPASNPHVGDMNNATDGDIYIAWALARAAQAWRQPAYAAKAEPSLRTYFACA